jgi:hypothetical protein
MMVMIVAVAVPVIMIMVVRMIVVVPVVMGMIVAVGVVVPVVVMAVPVRMAVVVSCRPPYQEPQADRRHQRRAE